MLRLKTFNLCEEIEFRSQERSKFTYTGTHDNGKTTLKFEVSLVETNDGKFIANVVFSDFKPQETLEIALTKIAEWCERAAKGIKDHRFEKTLPT